MLIFGEWIIFCPTFLFQIGNYVLASNRASLFSEKPDRLTNPLLMVPQPPVAHTVGRFSSEFIQPEMDLLKGLSE
jgi:hypothetical protein